ncbi:MAG TPA: GNAT family N-acetyltransferase [Bryobacteraceae bacterium]|nr:GNAT family N-acetyltransferase [Bryobacteraceae bacterium]
MIGYAPSGVGLFVSGESMVNSAGIAAARARFAPAANAGGMGRPGSKLRMYASVEVHFVCSRTRGRQGSPFSAADLLQRIVLPISDALARRLETAEAVDAAGCAEAQCALDVVSGASVKPVAGGVAVFCGVGSPLTHALGIGMHGPVTADDLDDVELFFEERGAIVTLDVCPHADASLRELLAQRDYRIAEFINVMVCGLPAAESFKSPPCVQVRAAKPDEHEQYIRAVIGGFFGRKDLTEDERRLGSILFNMSCTTAFLAEIDDSTVGGGGMSVRNRIASLFGDATLPEYRNRGVHTSVIQARMEAAAAQACDVITAGTVPGSGSQRNYERLGFQVAYTKVTMVKA